MHAGPLVLVLTLAYTYLVICKFPRVARWPTSKFECVYGYAEATQFIPRGEHLTDSRTTLQES